MSLRYGQELQLGPLLLESDSASMMISVEVQVSNDTTGTCKAGAAEVCQIDGNAGELTNLMPTFRYLPGPEEVGLRELRILVKRLLYEDDPDGSPPVTVVVPYHIAPPFVPRGFAI